MSDNDRKTKGGDRRTLLGGIGVALLIAAALVGYRATRPASGELTGSAVIAAPEAPAEAARWVNGEPLSMKAARGQVVLVEGWHPA